jgi:hypothetical protein
MWTFTDYLLIPGNYQLVRYLISNFMAHTLLPAEYHRNFGEYYCTYLAFCFPEEASNLLLLSKIITDGEWKNRKRSSWCFIIIDVRKVHMTRARSRLLTKTPEELFKTCNVELKPVPPASIEGVCVY